MKERTIRFGYLGIIFLLTAAFAIWYTDGKLPNLLKTENNGKLIELLIAVISTPGLGFMLSSIAIGILRTFCKKNYEFLLPKKEYAQKYYNFIHDSFNKMNSGIDFDETTGLYSVKNFNTLYINHQILLRQVDKIEIINFLTRRMDIYWTHVNTIFSIISGFLFGFIVSYPFHRSPDFLKMLWIIPVLLYIYFGYHSAIKLLMESNDFEKRFLLKGKNSEI